MMKQMLIVIGILLIFGCADVSKENQLQTGCSGGSESTPENEYISPAPTPSDTTAPTISSTSPSSTTDISFSSNITITFSESMDSASINTSNFTLVDNSGNSVTGEVSYSSNVATFNPSSDLNIGTTYTITVGTGVKDSAGNALASSSSITFSPMWTQHLGTINQDYAYGITTDSSGSIDVTGYTSGNFGTYVNAGTQDIFLAKYDSNGVRQWILQQGTIRSDRVREVTIDSNGDVYVVGETEGGLDGNTNAGNTDIFLVKYNTNGVRQWTKQFGTSSYDNGQSVAIDLSNNVYVSGYGPTISKFDSNGNKIWNQQLDGSQGSHGVDTDSNGNIYVAGTTSASLDGNTSYGKADLFIVKYNSNGVKQWTKQLGTSEIDYAYGLVTDANGNSFFTGYTYGSLDGNISAGGTDIFLVKYNSNGVRQWTRQHGSNLSERAYGITADSSGNIYVTGETGGSLDSNANAGDIDVFVVKYNSNGVKQWTKQLGTSNGETAEDIATDSSGNIYVAVIGVTSTVMLTRVASTVLDRKILRL